MKYANKINESKENNPACFVEKIDCSNEQSYNRKQKSLGLLCINFFNLYDEYVEIIHLNDAAAKLGVERRRMYDVVNVFESLGVLVKKAKTQYYFKGLGGIADTIKELKEEALNDTLNILNKEGVSVRVSCDEDGKRTLLDQNTGSCQNPGIPALAAGSSFAKCSSSTKKGTRTGKSLRQLSEEFVKLLLYSDGKPVTLDQAARILLTDANNSSETRCKVSKVRRLYDIANVLHSIGLIEKTHYMNTGKPAFKWLGLPKETLLVSKKRIFGADLTSMSIKRNKTVSSMNLNSNSREPEQNMCDVAHRHSPFGFDPSPIKLPKADDGVIKTKTSSHAVMNLASAHLPSYGNQALQGLFAHYMEAWDTWYTKIGKELKSSEFSLPSPLRSS